ALVRAIQQFIRMYRPHEAREDTVLFPAFHALFTEEEFDKLGDQFEQKEQQLLGSGGFEGTVEQVAQLERALGIYDLSKFTPASCLTPRPGPRSAPAWASWRCFSCGSA